jgi:hypothetical protein
MPSAWPTCWLPSAVRSHLGAGSRALPSRPTKLHERPCSKRSPTPSPDREILRVSVDLKVTHRSRLMGDHPAGLAAVSELLSVEQFALALRPFVSRSALDVAAPRPEPSALDRSATEEALIIPVSLPSAPASSFETPAGPFRVPSHGDGSINGEGAPSLEQFVAKVHDAISPPELVSIPRAPRSMLDDRSGQPNSVADEVLPPANLTRPDIPAGLQRGQAQMELGVASPIGLSIAAPEEMPVDSMLAQLRVRGEVLSDPVSLFPGPDDSPGEPTGPELGSVLADSWDSDRPSRSTPLLSSRISNTRDRLQRAGIGNPMAEHGAGTDPAMTQAITELASRLIAAAERLEDVAKRLLPAAPSPLLSAPRPFRGRVDG